MRKLLVCLLILGFIFIIAGCGAEPEPQPDPAPPQQQENPDDDLTENFNEHNDINPELRDRIRIVEEETVPEPVMNWFQEFGDAWGAYVYEHPDATYVRINVGERPTGGYGIVVEDYIEEEYPRIILVDVMMPGDEDMVTQVITYPSVILQIDTDMATGYEVRTLDGEVFPVESILIFADLELPEENQEIGNPVEVRGRIVAFEGSFIVRVIDADDEVIHEEHLQADSGGPAWGNFHEEIRYPVPETEEGRIEIGEYSAKDGEYIMRDYVAVRFKNTTD